MNTIASILGFTAFAGAVCTSFGAAAIKMIGNSPEDERTTTEQKLYHRTKGLVNTFIE